MARRGRDNRPYNRAKAPAYRDPVLIPTVLSLLAFGLIMLYSTSYYDAALTYDGDATYYLKRQLLFTGIGLVGMFIASRIPVRLYRLAAPYAYVGSIALILLLVPFGTKVNGALRWFYIGPISVQPSEIAKFATILFVASLICKYGKNVQNWKCFLLILGMVAVVAFLLRGITSNLSSALIIFAIAFCMLFVASAGNLKFFIFGGFGVTAAASYIYAVTHYANNSFFGYHGARVRAWLDPERYANTDSFQTLQALYAIGSGGFLGKGLGQSMQKLGFIPEAQNDMIFSIICEELGIFGATCVIGMFIILLYRFLVIVNNTEDLFSAMVVVGVMAHIATQVIVNIAVVTNTIPNTGVTLPFFSYGGSATLFLMVEIGMVISVSRNIRSKET